MKKIEFKLYSLLALIGLILLGACSDDDLSKEAEITLSFKVKKEVVSESGKVDNLVFNSSISGNTITIKVAPHYNAATILESAIPVFYLSKGATVTPDPALPQNFGQEGGVKYTVTSENGKNQQVYTVTWGISDILPSGAGFSFAEIGTAKNFVELGYPGEVGNFGQSDSKLYGDLVMYHAYCGDHIIMLSRGYITSAPASPHTIKVVNKNTLIEAGSLNLGSIAIADIHMVTSDYKGKCVAVVSKGGETEFFYWAQPGDAPKSVGKIGINLALNAGGANNFQVAGDIAGNAWITALAERNARGEHYRIKVTDGSLASQHSMVETGFASNDCSGFQMISPLDDSDQPSFVVGDAEGAVAQANSIHCYVNTFTGLTSFTMPALWQSTLQQWWVGTGVTTARIGGRAPYVTALPVNGKTYVVVTSGTGWWHSAAVLDANLQTLAHPNLNIAYGINRGWSYGAWVDWYWDEEKNEANLAIWFGRLGLYTYKLTCYE